MLELIPGGRAEGMASVASGTLQCFLRAAPVRLLGVVIPDGGRLRVAEPLGVPSVVSGVNQQGVHRIHQQVPVSKMLLVILARKGRVEKSVTLGRNAKGGGEQNLHP